MNQSVNVTISDAQCLEAAKLFEDVSEPNEADLHDEDLIILKEAENRGLLSKRQVETLKQIMCECKVAEAVKRFMRKSNDIVKVFVNGWYLSGGEVKQFSNFLMNANELFRNHKIEPEQLEKEAMSERAFNQPFNGQRKVNQEEVEKATEEWRGADHREGDNDRFWRYALAF
jgi:hypothetical protein